MALARKGACAWLHISAPMATTVSLFPSSPFLITCCWTWIMVLSVVMQMTLTSKSSVPRGAYWDVYAKGRLTLCFLLFAGCLKTCQIKAVILRLRGKVDPVLLFQFPFQIVNKSQWMRDNFLCMSFEEQSWIFRNEGECWKEVIKPENSRRCLEGIMQGKDMGLLGRKEGPCDVMCPCESDKAESWVLCRPSQPGSLSRLSTSVWWGLSYFMWFLESELILKYEI